MGNHTFKIELSYEKCPDCEKIFETRSGYQYESGSYIKRLKCPKCQKEFKKELKRSSRGPIFGEASKPEMEWGER